jgi:hypothetical protein
MGADQSRSRGWAGLACLVALAVGVSLAATTGGASAAASTEAASGGLGSSCATPYVLSESYGNTASILTDTDRVGAIGLGGFYPPGVLSWESWTMKPGYVVCSVRMQLQDGALVPPTAVFPYPTPTPTGGQYDETANPASRFSSITITAARSLVPAGSSCNYPQESSLLNSITHNGPKSHVSVKVVDLSPTSVRLRLTPHSRNLVLCPKADILVSLTSPEGLPVRQLSYYVSVKPHGGLTSAVTIPAGSNPGEGPRRIEAWAFARVVKAKG